MSDALASCLYVGEVVHQRVRPSRHRLRYRVFSALLDLDELPQLDRRLRLFGHNRLNIFSFLDRDHGDGTGAPLRPWVEHHLERAGIELAGGAIRLLCYPRLFGYVFNPLSVYFCHRADGALAAMIYEVNNTFGERHSYLIPVDGVDAVRPAARSGRPAPSTSTSRRSSPCRATTASASACPARPWRWSSTSRTPTARCCTPRSPAGGGR